MRAAAYSVPLLLWGAVQYPSWVGDNIQRGANRPWLIFILVGIEQVTRITLALLLLERFQINALIISYFVGIMVKNILGYFINNRVCFPQRFYIWQSLVAPLLAGAVHYLILRWVTGLIWRGDQLSSILIFFIAILPSFPIFTFFYGLFGGWDDATLEEVHQGAGLSNFMRPLALVFWGSSWLGARLSPLHGRFSMSIRAEAMLEAASLEKERVSLVLSRPSGRCVLGTIATELAASDWYAERWLDEVLLQVAQQFDRACDSLVSRRIFSGLIHLLQHLVTQFPLLDQVLEVLRE